MSKKFALIVVLTSLLDFTLVTICFGHGNDYKFHFLSCFYYYNVFTSLVELWVFSAARISILLGATIGVLQNPKDGVPRLQKFKPVIMIISMLMYAYTMVKMLLFTDIYTDLAKPWFWTLFTFSILGSGYFYIAWALLCKVKPVISSPQNLNIQEDTSPLFENTSHTDTEIKGTSGSDKKGTSKHSKKKDKDEFKWDRANVKRLLAYSKDDIHYILIGMVFLLAASGCQIFIPLMTGRVIEAVAIEKSQAKSMKTIGLLAVFCTGSSIASGIRAGFFKIVISRLNIRIRDHLFTSLVNQEVGFYDSTKTGDLTSRLTSDTTTMSEALGLNINIFLRDLVKGAGVVFFLLKLSWKLSMVTVIGLPVVLVVNKLYGEYYRDLAEKVQDSLAEANEVADETCSSIRTVRSFANENNEAQRYRDKLALTYKLKVKEAIAYGGYIWSAELSGLSFMVGTLLFGGHLVVTNKMSPGDLVSFILYQVDLANCLHEIGGVYTGLMEAVGASSKVFEFIDRKPKIENTGHYAPDALHGKLEFQDVTFSYPSRPDTNVLQNVSFTVNPGEIVALVGPSGGGKSSCVNLLQHFYETKSGQVLLDGNPIKDYDHHFLHNQISLVGQEPVLYARSVKENIGYGLDTWTNDMIEHAAKLANAHTFITEMEDKYETQTGEKGIQLSGGQKQRVAIARAIVRNPSVLLLDEATSALDSESEHVVQQAIYNSLAGRTVLIIAHRLSTVEKAHRIVVLNKGKVVEQGSHKELLQAQGMYANLVQRQLLGFDMEGAKEKPSTALARQSSTPISASSFKSISSMGRSTTEDHDDVEMMMGTPKGSP